MTLIQTAQQLLHPTCQIMSQAEVFDRLKVNAQLVQSPLRGPQVEAELVDAANIATKQDPLWYHVFRGWHLVQFHRRVLGGKHYPTGQFMLVFAAAQELQRHSIMDHFMFCLAGAPTEYPPAIFKDWLGFWVRGCDFSATLSQCLNEQLEWDAVVRARRIVPKWEIKR